MQTIIVDDDLQVLESIQTLLELEGIDAKTYINPLDFVANLASLEEDGLIVMDYSMKEMNGVEALRRLRDKYPKKPLAILYTGNGPHIPRVERDFLASAGIEIIDKNVPSKLVNYIINLSGDNQ
jgi:FixJ family two-component response regulator